MTIASEITRIQGAKSDIRQAIIDKGVDVCADLTIDNYACCIDEIQTGGGGKTYELLVVAGGGAGANGGGGGGGIVYRKGVGLTDNTVDVIVGKGGCKGQYYCYCINLCNGGDSYFGDIKACGGGAGGTPCCGSCKGFNGGSGGGGGWSCCGNCCGGCAYCNGLEIQGRYGNEGYGENCYLYCRVGGGGGGATCNYGVCKYRYNGGRGFQSDISGEDVIYSGGGGGSGWGCHPPLGEGGDGVGGNGALYDSSLGCYCPATNPTTCGSGGGGGNPCGCAPTSGADGVVIIRYPTAIGDTSEGGCKYTCGDYTIHCFTSDGMFIADTSKKQIRYLAVGGGGGGNLGGGGGGEVKLGEVGFEDTLSLNITIGAGGNGGSCSADNSTDGGDTCLGDIVAHGGKRATNNGLGGASGSGCAGGAGYNCSSCSKYRYGGGGGGARGIGGNGYTCNGGNGGNGFCGYGGGGGGTGYSYSGCGKDGGGNGAYCYGNNATNYGGGGGGGGSYGTSCYGGKGCQGVVDICYPCDGSFGVTTATGGDSCYLCGDICVHRFTTNGTFTVVS